jgi:hypothetical protein
MCIIERQKTDDLVKRLSLYKASTGKVYDSDFATINLWALNDVKTTFFNKVSSQNGTDNHKFEPKPAVSIWDEEEVQG